MKKVIVLIGISGSGKSTWAKRYKAERPEDKIVILNRDSLRAAVPGASEHVVFGMMMRGLQWSLDNGDVTVILDNTNVKVNTLQKVMSGVKDLPEINWSSVVMPDSEFLDVCIERVNQRAKAGGLFVPEQAIRDQHKEMFTHLPTILECIEKKNEAHNPH